MLRTVWPVLQPHSELRQPDICRTVACSRILMQLLLASYQRWKAQLQCCTSKQQVNMRTVWPVFQPHA
jgi:hypothetical protein